jgi:ABC-type multidrug transport system fused ATPase/permease subunit
MLNGSFASSQLRELLSTRRGPVAALAAGSILAGLAESAILAILAEAAAALVNGTSRLHLSLGPLHLEARLGTLLAIGLGLALFRLALQMVISVVPARIADETQARLRSGVFAAYTRASWDQQARDREGYLQEVLTNQVTQATISSLQAATLAISLVTFMVLVISALTLNVVAAVLVLVTAGGLSMILRPLGALGNRRAHALSRANIEYAGGVSEAVRVAEETHVFGAEASQRARTDELIATMRPPNFQTQFLARLVPGIYQSLIYLLVVVALILLYATGTGHVASLGAVVLLLVRAGSYGQQAQAAVQTLRQAEPYVRRLQEAESRYAASTAIFGSEPLESVQTLDFDHVSFSYGRSRPALSDISFEVVGGEAVGIIGPSGAGKSTLVQILLGLRIPGSGRYLINGVPADQFDRDDWRRQVAYVPQEPRLLHSSVADNIRFFRRIDDASVERAARLAGIHEEVTAWPAGYDTVVGPRADAVSGGQQQRICLARALAANPGVLVLDEPTSALDPRAEQLIQDSLGALKHKLTLFIVAHRMSTLEICERVMVIIDGRLEAFDRIAELRTNNEYYRSALLGRPSDPLAIEQSYHSSGSA